MRILKDVVLVGFSTSGADGFVDALTLTFHFPHKRSEVLKGVTLNLSGRPVKCLALV